MKRRERLEGKLERREDWAASASTKSDQAFNEAGTMAHQIPFGQPIMVGHHSEKADRAFRDKIGRKMDRAVEMSDKAEHHEEKAEGLACQLDNSIFSDDDDALEALKMKIDAMETRAERIKAINAAWRKAKGALGWTDGLDLAKHETAEIVRAAAAWGNAHKGIPYPTYVSTNLRANIRRLKGRIVDVRIRQQRQANAENSETGINIIGGDYVNITFAEKPSRDVLDALKAAGFHWSRGSWSGRRDAIPECVREGETG